MEKTRKDINILGPFAKSEVDPIIRILEVYKKNTNPDKVNLTVGSYMNDELKPIVFKAVRAAEERVYEHGFNRGYLPATGDEEFNRLTQQTLFDDDSDVIKQGRILTVQALSGSGGLRLAGELARRFISENIYIPDFTWPNHPPMYTKTGFNVFYYPYYSTTENRLNIEEIIETLDKAEKSSLVVLHVCGHNPTGHDPTAEEWIQIMKVMKKRELIPLFDMAYQGFVSGDLKNDAYPIYLFLENGFEMFIAQSFSKCMGMYGERAGPLHIIVNDPSTLPAIKSQLHDIAQRLYLCPLGSGSRIVKTLLGDPELKALWLEELKTVVERINLMRKLLYEGLKEVECPGNWEYLKEQRGMFAFTHLTPEQCRDLIYNYNVFLIESGRISLSGLNQNNIKFVCESIKNVILNPNEKKN